MSDSDIVDDSVDYDATIMADPDPEMGEGESETNPDLETGEGESQDSGLRLPPVPFLADHFRSSSEDLDFGTPEPTSGEHHPSDLPEYMGEASMAQRREIVIDNCRLDPAYAQRVLDSYSSSRVGWCDVVSLGTTKKAGYAQVSFDTANNFAVLGKVLLWASGEDLTAEKDQCSHLCPHKLCKTVGHVIAESAKDNNARKNCLVWIDCHHCPKKILVCQHSPYCRKFCGGFSSWEDFLQRGVCRTLTGLVA